MKGLIIFDMDGVLVDVSASYRETVRRTASLFLSGAVSFERLPDPLFSLKDLAAVKQSGGLNNDWDLSRTVCSLLFSKLSVPHVSQAPDPWLRYAQTIAHCDAAPLARFLAAHAMPLTALFARAAHRGSAFVDGLYTGDVGSGNVIKQIFQEIYLGGRIFEKTYGFPPRMTAGEGLYRRESLIIAKDALQRLGGKYLLAIATGRPAAEAALPLRHHGLEGLFRRVCTLDDCLVAEAAFRADTGRGVSLSKPSPFMLDRIVEELGAAGLDVFYVGDMPDDMAAATASAFGVTAVGFLASSPDPQRLRTDLERAGAHCVVASPEALEAFFLADAAT